MKYFGAALSEKHSVLSRIIRKKDSLEEAKQSFFEIHAAVNMPEVYGTQENELSLILKGMQPSEYAVMPTAKDETVAWILWHLARIEDVTMNMLVSGAEQIFDEHWRKRICSPVCDTGNSMDDDAIMIFSHSVDTEQLILYRNAVAERTRDIVTSLMAEDIRRRVSQADISRLRQSGAVTEDEETVWLLDFWGGKDVAGLLLMPPPRHAMMHLNSCARIRQLILTKKSFYRS